MVTSHHYLNERHINVTLLSLSLQYLKIQYTISSIFYAYEYLFWCTFVLWKMYIGRQWSYLNLNLNLNFKACETCCLCSISRAFENQQLVWNISVCLQRTSQHRDSTLSCKNDLLQAVDNEGGAILVLLDLSAAFDAIDHQKLLNPLNQSFGIIGVALKWFESYLKDRTQTVQIGSCTSTPVTWKYWVPQGSVLGPILFTLYTTPLGNIIRKHGLNFHLYADDTQLYISFQPGVSVSKETAISCLESCIKDMKIWMTNNLLKLNGDKTELIVITTHSNISQNQHIGINIGDSLITPSSEPPRNLGVLFDSTCSLNDHVSQICKIINYNLYSIGKIRKYLATPTAEKMINCSITSRLDYCNSLLYGAKGYNISQLQLCQNNAAGCRPCAANSQALHGKAPTYISQLLSLYTPTRPWDQRTKISSEYQDAVWKALVDAALRMPLHLFEPFTYTCYTC